MGSAMDMSPMVQNTFDCSEFKAVKLIPALDGEINKILESADPLDTSNFDVVRHFNELFPTSDKLGVAITNLETLIMNETLKIKAILRSQIDSKQVSSNIIKELQQEIQNLVSKVRQIKLEARNSENMVSDITNGIKSLDGTKKNLALSLSMLKRINIVVAALAKVKDFASQKQYAETFELLELIIYFAKPFKDYKGINQFKVLLERIMAIQIDTFKTIFADYERLFALQKFDSPQLYLEACRVLEVMEIPAKEDLIKWYCELQLKDYLIMFRLNQELGGIEEVSRRYSWLKRLLKTFDDQHSQFFPSGWRVDEKAVLLFCTYTSKDLGDLLLAKESQPNFDTIQMLGAFEITTEFEEKLNMRFPKPVPKFQIGSPGETYFLQKHQQYL